MIKIEKTKKGEISLRNCLTYDDESRCYYKLWGDLFFHVPHYVKSFSISDTKVSVTWASGSGISMSKCLH